MSSGAPAAWPLADSQRVEACALFLASRIQVRALERRAPLALAPVTVRVGARGLAFVFRFGAVVLVEVTREEEQRFLAELEPLVEGRFDDPEREVAELRVDPERGERIDASGTLVIREISLERLTVVAEILAKSTVLAHYEDRVARVFDGVEQSARSLGAGEAVPRARKRILRDIGEVLLIQTQTVGRVEVTEKPEITWDRPELDRLYERLAVEYELRERDRALARKLEVISSTAETYHDLLQHRQVLRVEWYIVILILAEILLILYDIFWPR